MAAPFGPNQVPRRAEYHQEPQTLFGEQLLGTIEGLAPPRLSDDVEQMFREAAQEYLSPEASSSQDTADAQEQGAALSAEFVTRLLALAVVPSTSEAVREQQLGRVLRSPYMGLEGGRQLIDTSYGIEDGRRLPAKAYGQGFEFGLSATPQVGEELNPEDLPAFPDRDDDYPHTNPAERNRL